MSQLIENKQISIEEILEKLRYQAQIMPVSPTSARYLHALESFQSSVFTLQSSGFHGGGESSQHTPCASTRVDSNHVDSLQNTESSDPLTTYNSQLATSLTDWLVNRWLMNIPFSTASLYLDIISSLYGSAVKDGQLPPTKIFSQIKSDLKALGPQGWKKGIDDEIFARALRLTKNIHLLLSDDSIAADLILWSLTHALQPLEEIAMMKRDDLMGGGHSDRRDEGLSAKNPATSGLSSDEINASVASQDLRLKTDNSPSHTAQPILQSRYCEADTQKQVLSLILSNLSLGDSRRKYVFPLRQSERTPKQLSKHIKKIVNALFKRARLPQATDPFQTVEALWAYAALRSGIPASQIVSYLGHAPLGLPVLKLSVVSLQSSDCGQAADTPNDTAASAANTSYCEADTTRSVDTPQDTAASAADTARSADTFKEYFSTVGKIFLENPPRWYAMSLRPGVRFTQVCRRIQLLSQTHTARSANNSYCGPAADTPFSSLHLFYPCEEIARAIGKKIVIRQRPFIHSVVFFRAKLTDIGSLFAKIGDLAWCYRQSARPGAPYADISDIQFRLFQQTIARFTPDYEVASIGELELKKNDRVQIVGGLFAGHEASVVSTVPCASLRDKGNSSPRTASEGSRLKTFNDNTAAKAADTSSVVYRLNIVGDNGIEWRINVDSRLVMGSGSVMGSGHPDR